VVGQIIGTGIKPRSAKVSPAVWSAAWLQPRHTNNKAGNAVANTTKTASNSLIFFFSILISPLRFFFPDFASLFFEFHFSLKSPLNR
jgi:hypothetical protein